jgi:pimeloyl-ACP methyl ester carboxylesterase
MKLLIKLLVVLFLCGSTTTGFAAEIEIQVIGTDGFALEGRLAYPDDTVIAELPRVIVLLHGSGPQSMDEDLTAVTRDNKSNLFFKVLSDALITKGFGVLRYHKRSHQIQLAAKADPAFAQSNLVKAVSANPLKYFIDDGAAAVRKAREVCPAAKIYLLGHSQGTYIALWLTEEMEEIAGIGLIGFANPPLETLVLEQTVYRSLPMFDKVDEDRDGYLNKEELAQPDPMISALKAQMALIDLDGDGRLARAEFMAGNYTNLMFADMLGSAYREEEARRPRPVDIIKELDIPVVFLQGEWDNQTPAYNALAVQLANRAMWKKSNLSFHIFPKLGHALDRREEYLDLQFDTIDPEAKTVLVETLDELFKGTASGSE